MPTSNLFPCILLILLMTGGEERVTCSSNGRGKVLLFGGNGLIGGAATEALLHAGYDVTLVSRGTWYWDTEVTIKPYVRHVHCDRYSVFMMAGSITRECPELMEFIESVDHFEAVIDFSAYEVAVITQAFEAIGKKAGVYIYISSDSVYEVCDKNHDGFTMEGDAVRPSATDRREELARMDDYGNKKLLCEEELKRFWEVEGIPYVAVRLPDVIGPRDNTDRWWTYQLWIKLAQHLDVPMTYPAFLETQPLGFVFSKDVGRGIVQLLDRKEMPGVLNTAYNFAFDEAITLPDFLRTIGNFLGLPNVPIQIDRSEDPYYLFPSVKKGPIHTMRAKVVLGWEPTPLRDAMRECVEFYERAVVEEKFERHLKKVLSKVGRDVFPRDKMMEGIKHMYLEKPEEKKDEL